MYDIVGKKRWYFLFSALITIPGLIFVLLGGLKPTIDFTGGTTWDVEYASHPSQQAVQQALVALGHPEAQVTRSPLGGNLLRIRTAPVDLLPAATLAPSASLAPATASPAASASASATPKATPAPTPKASASPALVARFGQATVRSVTTVGPIIGSDLIRSSAILIIVGELFILAYLWVRFGFRFGTAAIVALLHDVVVVVGTFAILGYLFGLEFDALFVTALLTIIGFSVHDTIVVFDRIRENRIRHAGEPFGAIVNHSILQTLGRSISTSLTVVVTLVALLLLGPASIRTFTLALLIGVVSGTYSSIFNASQILVAWSEWDARRKERTGLAGRQVRPLSR